jgi:gamma-glutamyltranspeptidase / glutathione hydrolase
MLVINVRGCLEMAVHRSLQVLATLLLVQATPALSGDLSPATWPIEQRISAEKLEAAAPSPPIAQVLENRTGMVAATLSPIAALAGVEALKHDGNAADAAVATALTQITTGLGANVSYAGILELVYYEAKSGKVYALDAGWNSWRGEHDPESLPPPDLSMLGLASPGFMAGIGAMHARFGKLPVKELYAPALWYAEKGVHVSPLLNAYFRL